MLPLIPSWSRYAYSGTGGSSWRHLLDGSIAWILVRLLPTCPSAPCWCWRETWDRRIFSLGVAWGTFAQRIPDRLPHLLEWKTIRCEEAWRRVPWRVLLVRCSWGVVWSSWGIASTWSSLFLLLCSSEIDGKCFWLSIIEELWIVVELVLLINAVNGTENAVFAGPITMRWVSGLLVQDWSKAV